MFLQDILSGQAENGNEKKTESSSSTSKHSPHNQHPDHHAIVRSVGFPTMEALAPRSTALTNLKRAAARVEVGCCEVYCCPSFNASYVAIITISLRALNRHVEMQFHVRGCAK